ncbi:MAG: PEP-CTERM sorting domain-containing protein [Smithellaceae bacterium]
MMKATSRILLTLAVVFVFTANVWATPVTFNPDLTGSSVTAVDYSWFGSLTAELAMSGDSFTLADNATQTLDFFTLTASQLFLIDGIYHVEATLAFSDPPIISQGTGNGFVWTLFGIITTMGLVWDDSTLPDYFTLVDGNQIKIDFMDTGAFGVGDTMMVQAQVTNLGNASTVPEPATMMLLGFGLIGIACVRRKYKQ